MRTSGKFRAPAVAGAFSVGAGLVHAAAAGSHSGDQTLVLMMALTAAAQVGVGIAAAVRGDRFSLTALAAINLVAAAVWVLSRTSGLPVVAGLAEPEAVGVADLIATLMELAAAAAAGFAVLGGERTRQLSLSPLCALAFVPALVGMTAPHAHGGAHDGHAAHGGAAHGEAAHQHAPSALAGHPVFSGVDTTHASDLELRAAKLLIDATRSVLGTRFPDRAAVVNAGYTSIGDGFPISRHEHFVNYAYMNDGLELDPDHVESIVLEWSDTGLKVVSGMYILEPGKTMADTPDVAGELATWHDHQNLCWDASGTRIAGIVKAGQCVPAGTFKPTPPMLHVWLADHECGPFAGIEGHGEACGTHHDH